VLSAKLVVRESAIAGVGLFARARIEAGEVCSRLSGTVMDDAAFAEYVAGRSRYSALAVAEGVNLVQDEDDPATMGNHSCDPNMWMGDAVTVVARRGIDIGVEATVDYALMTANEDWSMVCNCRSALCRGVVRGGDWRRIDLQQRYRGHWSPFIEQRIAVG
jgi:hypothetical protein